MNDSTRKRTSAFINFTIALDKLRESYDDPNGTLLDRSLNRGAVDQCYRILLQCTTNPGGEDV